MAWTVLLLGLLACGSGADSQTVVTQEPSLSVSLGGTVTLTCGLSSGSVSTSNYPSWYQQTPGRAPRTLNYKINTRPSGVPDRFSVSISENKAALTITGSQPEDEADYYCNIWDGNSKTYTVFQSQKEVRQKPLCSPGLLQSPLLVSVTKSSSVVTCVVRSHAAPAFLGPVVLTMSHPCLQFNF
ncbi:Ig lambda chain V region 4A [Pteropus alecto]|uniref:Ig lambda chain V region 4A n=1 Tax=Pteropus alecto TaxID=9402 RepID=L5KYA6_PTEAL|nr:Ig lambda chain V region 4A [Pteropus alecto]